jgi:membrane protease subunit HflK
MRYAVAAFALVLAGYLLTSFSQVRPGERAVVRRFGRVVATPGPGLWIGLPVGLDRVDRVPVDMVRRVTVGYQPCEDESEENSPPGQLLTGDHNLVNAQVLVDYTIRPEEIEDYVLQSEQVDGLIARAAEAAVSAWVASRRVDDVLLRGKVELPNLLPAEIEEKLEGYKLGIAIQGVSASYLFPPDEVKPAFDEVTRAQSGIATILDQARQEAARGLRQAEAEKLRLERLARAQATEQLLRARAEAAAFLNRAAQFHRLRIDNPAALAGIWWEEMGQILKKLNSNGRIDLLDHHLAGDALDITIMPPSPKKK